MAIDTDPDNSQLSLYVPNGQLKSMGAEITVDAGDIVWSSDPEADLGTDGHVAVEGSAISLFGFGMVKHFRATSAAGATITATLGSDSSP